jgi:hypothetical protein
MLGYLLILAPTAAMAYAAITAQTAAGTFIWSMLTKAKRHAPFAKASA